MNNQAQKYSFLSLSPMTVLPCSPLEQIEIAYETGFDAVGLRLEPAMSSDIPVMNDSQLQGAIEKQLQIKNLQVADVEVFRVSPSTNICLMKPALQYANALGAKNLLFTSLPLADYQLEQENILVDKIRELCELSTLYKIRPMVEFMHFRGIQSLQDALRIANKVNHPALGICIDTLHLMRSGGTPALLRTIPTHLLCSVQLCDAPSMAPDDLQYEARFNRLYPGDGPLCQTSWNLNRG